MKDEYKLDEFLDMKRRWEAFRVQKGRKPNYVTDRAGGKIPRDVFNDMVIRYERFVASTGREPSFVRVKADTVSDEWTTTGYFKQDFQDTDHTCGPSSLQMALSALGCNVKEDELAKAAGTLNSGTPHKGMLKAVNYAAKKCKKNITAVFKYFSAIGWPGIIKHIENGGEVIIHLVTRPGLDTDVNGQVVWRGAFGHYVYLVGVNRKKGVVRIADPTKGIREFTQGQVVQAINNLSQPSILLIK